ncbi:nuclease-related domain-containing protein [Neobacillus dielmonensis]|uniref:nuclease-related domain-containing protein n=1 Tax=Neobacillus dielmonensis TaxID=1347369 RepID=UPI000693AC86|nr:nuclease-related domain-containing protein [Neobacillus dielmonensis]
MILKERPIPYRILILEALLRRLPLNHEKYQQIKEELGRRYAGYMGEKSLDYYLRSLPKEFLILHDLNLPDGEYICQIDTLLLTPQYALIIDAKNMAGKLIFDTDNEQFIQMNNGIEKGYPDPISQAERHQKYVMAFLKEHGYPPVPVEYLVVLSNGYSNYVLTGKNSHKVRPRVCKSDAFESKLKFFERMHHEICFTSKELRKLSRQLIKMNTLPTIYILNKYGIKLEELLPGVFCPFCFFHPLVRKKQSWYCSSCLRYSNDAHMFALLDYFLLIEPQISNQKFRMFARLDSIHVAGRLLRSEHLAGSGSKKQRVYTPVNFPSGYWQLLWNSQKKLGNSQIGPINSQIKVQKSQINR